jgi:hypothetical protein
MNSIDNKDSLFVNYDPILICTFSRWIAMRALRPFLGLCFALSVPSRCIGLPAYGVGFDRQSLDECLVKQDQIWFSTTMIRDLVELELSSMFLMIHQIDLHIFVEVSTTAFALP